MKAMPVKRRLAAILLMKSLLVGGIASAQEPSSTVPDTNEAARLQAAGFMAFKAAEYKQAIHDFEQAYQRNHKALLWGMVARAQLQLANCEQALASARRFAEEASSRDADSAKELLAQLGDECVQVRIESEPAGATLVLDGEPSQPGHLTPWTGWLKAGDHSVVVKNGSTEQDRPLHIPEGEHKPIRLAIVLTPAVESQAAAPTASKRADADASSIPPSPEGPPLVVAMLPPAPTGPRSPEPAPAQQSHPIDERTSESNAPAKVPSVTHPIEGAVTAKEVPAAPEHRRPIIFAWAVGGGAVVVAGIGGVLALQSRSISSDIAGGEHTGAQVAQMDANYTSKTRTANTLFVVGAGLAALSAGFFIFHF